MEKIVTVLVFLSVLFSLECNPSTIPVKDFMVTKTAAKLNETKSIPTYPQQRLSTMETTLDSHSSFLSTNFGENERDQNGSPQTMMGNLNENKLVLKLDRDYTPLEIAEYIYTTGDEQGISQSVLEMVQDGKITLSRDNVIQFMEGVQSYLDRMRKSKESEQMPVEIQRNDFRSA